MLHAYETFELDEGRAVFAYQDGIDSLVYTSTPVDRFVRYPNMRLEEVKPMEGQREEGFWRAALGVRTDRRD
ncbi:hypothetical protein PAT3040_03958 [Paenibacillus agaridevorans]|uniref:Uncharacterized protein n=1 Tax=Paenibacillus agaridevorans TaxID=171404 RepID=A0A2R5F0Y6_9BACL|nr:hypothetical protein PAT3040_03958 [Paenibacillus agaridevorans]